MMLYNCTHMATVSVKGLSKSTYSSDERRSVVDKQVVVVVQWSAGWVVPVRVADDQLDHAATAADATVLRLNGAVVEVVKVGDDDGDRKSDGKYAGDGTQRADELAERADRQHVSIADRCHRHDGPPERVRDRLELRLALVVNLGEVDGAREQDNTDEQKEHEQTELSHARPDCLAEDLQSLRVPRQLEYTENTDEAYHPEDGQRHGAIARRPTVLGDSCAEREEVRRDGDHIDNVHDVAEESDVVGRRCEPDHELDGKPDDAGSLDDEERFGEQRYVVVVFEHVARNVTGRRRDSWGRAGRRLVAVVRRVNDAETPEVWKRFEAEDDDWDEYNDDRR